MVGALRLVHATGVVHCGVSLDHVLLARSDDLASVRALARGAALPNHLAA